MSEARIQFIKTDRARYISHLDLMRTFQRASSGRTSMSAIRRASTPTPMCPLPCPCRWAFPSQCEILEFGLPEGEDRSQVPERLTRALPEGITVTRCYDGGRPFKELCWVNYIITLEYDAGAPVGAENAVRNLLNRESLVVTKKSKKAKSGQVQVDLIPLIHRVDYESRRDAIVLDAVLRAQNPGLNPTLLVETIRRECPEVSPDYVSCHRKQGPGQEFPAFSVNSIKIITAARGQMPTRRFLVQPPRPQGSQGKFRRGWEGFWPRGGSCR